MEYRRLGRTGLLVSPLCFGTMNFGWQVEEPESHRVMDRALDLGLNFWDTADVYGGWQEKQNGWTERYIGSWWAGDENKRDRVILATKVYNPMPREGQPEPNRDQRLLNARKIIRHCEDSLKRLQTDRIDLYQMHHVDRECPADEVWEAMETLIRQGKVIYVGSSNFAAWDIATYNQVAQRRGTLGLVSEQSHYNLNTRMVELEVAPCCRHYGVGIIPWSPLSGGMLGGVLEKLKEGRRASENMLERVEKQRGQLEAWEGLCKELGEKPGEVALAWLLHNDAVTAPIIGPRTVEQLEASMRSVEIELSEQTLAKIDEIWPGPGGEAPKAYAW